MTKKKIAATQKKTGTKKAVKKLSFEEAYAELEQVVDSLESSQLGLSESLALYQKGVGCLKVCHQALERAERKIELLTGVGDDGEPETEDFDDQELDLEAKASRRSARRGATKSASEADASEDGIDEGPSLF
ncbi:MAG: exodeoxyribonuclease VII small subunit [Planctomycetota bacterium]|nr:exodeoxyribonuclease VII small subunit [Planctomycetota bacterium]MEC7449986.1 exodeoxyribonuclease VII small subunit [Planctomycetota bacterium]MEC8240474.1 exodeoxyribonuclease VII small subunit [Planctomycetota bacterium]MEC8304840.1 exodeoxyribonuclease VII small subunit [Planctomycetota bacterium]MEC8782469.1 exodeoxyribonuclease VII small subunit [Planctomycetota bacterium]